MYFTGMSRSAIILPNWIGDLILALSVISRKEYPSGDSITLIVPEHMTQLSRLLTKHPVLSYQRGSKKQLQDSILLVKEGNFDKLYILPHSFSSAWFAFSCGIKSRRGLRGQWRRFLLTEVLSRKNRNKKAHITREYSAVLEVPYREPEAWQGFPIAASTEYAGAIVLCPGAAYGPAKQWRGYAQLVKLLPEYEFVILGDKRDAAAAKEIAPRMPHRVHNLVGSTPLDKAASIIAGASVVISNDSGLMHLAGYLGKPVVGIYGSTTPVWTRPMGKLARIVSANCSCSPCFERTCKDESYRCLENISPETVVSLVREIIGKAEL